MGISDIFLSLGDIRWPLNKDLSGDKVSLLNGHLIY